MQVEKFKILQFAILLCYLLFALRFSPLRPYRGKQASEKSAFYDMR